MTLNELVDKSFEPFQKRIAELEQENAELKAKISMLPSCENRPENKGGHICEKEHYDKCLAQKIQHIKELEERLTKAENQIHCLLVLLTEG